MLSLNPIALPRVTTFTQLLLCSHHSSSVPSSPLVFPVPFSALPRPHSDPAFLTITLSATVPPVSSSSIVKFAETNCRRCEWGRAKDRRLSVWEEIRRQLWRARRLRSGANSPSRSASRGKVPGASRDGRQFLPLHAWCQHAWVAALSRFPPSASLKVKEACSPV